MTADRPRRVTFVYFSYTHQVEHVVDAMAEVFAGRGYDVRKAPIEFTDKRWNERFQHIPLPHLYRDLLGMLPAQLRGATGAIVIPDDASHGPTDLVVIGSPTWWFRTNIPIRSYLQSPEAGALLNGTPFAAFAVCRRYWRFNLNNVRNKAIGRGGRFLDATHFAFQGGQVRSLLSLISYLGTGETRERYLGVKIPPSNLQPKDLDEARGFANGLLDRLGATPGQGVAA